MGSAFSKNASKISPARKYPLRPPPPPHRPAPNTTSRPSANSKPTTQPDPTNPSSEPLEYTAPTPEPFDPQYAASLRRLGSVQPIDPFTPPPSSSSSIPQSPSTPAQQPTSPNFPSPSSSSPSSILSNPAIQVLTRRLAIQRAAEAEFADALDAGTEHQRRSFLDAVTLRRVLVLRDRGVESQKIERELGLKEGMVGRLGKKGVVGAAGMVGLVE